MSWINSTHGVGPGNGTNTHTIDPSTDGSTPFTATPGSLLVAIASGPVTHAWPVGWTERIDPVNSCEVSVATKVATGSDSATITHNGTNYPIVWAVYEFPEGSDWVTGSEQPSTTTNAANTLSGLPGTPVDVFYLAGQAGLDGNPSCSWESGVEASIDLKFYEPGTDGAYLAVGYEAGVTSTSVSRVGTIVNPSAGGVERGTFALTIAESPGEPVDVAGQIEVASAASGSAGRARSASGGSSTAASVSGAGGRLRRLAAAVGVVAELVASLHRRRRVSASTGTASSASGSAYTRRLNSFTPVVTVFDRPPLASGAPAPGTKGSQLTVTLLATEIPGTFLLSGINPATGCRITWNSDCFEVTSPGVIKRA